MNKRYLIPIVIALGLASAIFWYSNRDSNLPPAQSRDDLVNNLNPTPPPSPNPSPTPNPNPTPQPASSIPAEINLAVPFTSQAPHANWAEPYQNFCEEASILMAASYVLGQKINGPDDADAKLLAIMNFEIDKFGYHKDTNASEVATTLKEFYKIDKVQLLNNPTTNDIKQAVASGKVVIVPAAGKELDNPNFRGGGPTYHMLLVKGYTKDGKFITNDPGTRLGSNFTYTFQNLMDSIHDWNPDNIYNGKKVVIIVG